MAPMAGSRTTFAYALPPTSQREPTLTATSADSSHLERERSACLGRQNLTATAPRERQKTRRPIIDSLLFWRLLAHGGSKSVDPTRCDESQDGDVDGDG